MWLDTTFLDPQYSPLITITTVTTRTIGETPLLLEGTPCQGGTTLLRIHLNLPPNSLQISLLDPPPNPPQNPHRNLPAQSMEIKASVSVAGPSRRHVESSRGNTPQVEVAETLWVENDALKHYISGMIQQEKSVHTSALEVLPPSTLRR